MFLRYSGYPYLRSSLSLLSLGSSKHLLSLWDVPGTKGAVLDTRGMTASPRSPVGKTEVRPWRVTQGTVAMWVRLMQLPGL